MIPDGEGLARDEELRESEERFRSLAQSATDAFIGCTDRGQTVSFWNRAAETIFGYKAEEVVGKPVTTIISEQAREAHQDKMTQRLSSGELEVSRKPFESVGLRKNGSEFPLELSYGSWRANGKVFFIAIVRDISERKHEEIQYKTIIRAAMDGFWITDSEGRFLEINEAYSQLIGYSRDELLKMRITDVEAVEAPDETARHLRHIEEYGHDRFETKHKRQDGRTVDIEVSVNYQDTDGGRYFVFLRDATERKRIEAEFSKTKELSDALNKIDAAISSTRDIQQIMSGMMVESARIIGAESGMVLLREDESWIVRYLYGLPEELIGKRFSDREAKVSTIAAQTRRPVVITDTRHDKRVNREMMERLGVRSVLAVPLIIREKATGAIFYHYHSSAAGFSEAQVDFAIKLGLSVSLGLENARLYEAQRNIADTLQKALLMVPDKIPGVIFSHLYHSATEAAQVGGDFYDLFELEHGRVGIVIGDIAGKGLGAATLTSLVKDSIKAYAHVDTSPASIISKTNHIVMEAASEAAFATVFFGVLDTNTGILRYCNAGHPQPILRRASSATTLIATTSPVIGAFENTTFIESAEELRGGDILLLYTDGVTEARRGGEFFSEERLISYIERLSSTSEMAECVYDEVMQFAGGRLADDLAVLALSLD